VWLDAEARRAVHALKYAGLPRIADELADAMAGVQPERCDKAVLVPIPLAPKRQHERGYNQSEWLARALGRRWSLPVALDLLIRVRDTRSQTALTPEARLANVAGAFGMSNVECPMLNDHSTLDIEHSTLIIVDDVFTTGATLAGAARALEGAGAHTVLAVTFGRAVIPDFT
jgi:ComF family protein